MRTTAYKSIGGLTARILAEHEVEEPEVDVDALALKLGAKKVVTERMREHGRLELRGREPVVVVGSGQGRARRRFTIAHEIGHLVLADPGLDLSAIYRDRRLRSEEIFCDRFAEQLLMPAEWVRTEFVDKPQTLDTLVDFARRFGVSISAAMVRLHRVLRWSKSLLRFERSDGKWFLNTAVAWHPEPRLSIRSTESTRTVLELFALSGSHTRMWLPIGVEQREIFVGAEVWADDRWTIALVDPSRRRMPREPSGRTSDQVDSCMKLFYTLDDIDACILAHASNPKGRNEQRDSVGASRDPS